MRIRTVRHKGLRRFIEDDNTTALQPAVVPKLRRILSFLQDMECEDELLLVPGWKAHRLEGAPAGGRPQGRLEPESDEELADHVPDRPG